MAHVAQLFTYPVKGCAGVEVSRAYVGAGGLEHDRTFMAVDENGVFRSQRNAPLLATVSPHVSASMLHLKAPGRGELVIDIDTAGSRRDVELFGKGYQGIDQGDEAASWLTAVLGNRSRLVRVPPEHGRVTSGQTPGTAAYADSSPLLVTSCASLDALNERIRLRGGEAVPMDRFRANIVVDRWTEPHTADGANRLRIGGVELGFAKLAIRCSVTTLDQRTGRKQGHEPLRTLADYRRSGNGVAFGTRFAVLSEGTITVGAPIEIVGCFRPDVEIDRHGVAGSNPR